MSSALESQQMPPSNDHHRHQQCSVYSHPRLLQTLQIVLATYVSSASPEATPLQSVDFRPFGAIILAVAALSHVHLHFFMMARCQDAQVIGGRGTDYHLEKGSGGKNLTTWHRSRSIIT
jgi:hypothetical protein